MKKLLALLMTLVMTLSLVACGGEETSGPAQRSSDSIAVPGTKYTERLLLEMENPCAEGVVLDENGYPVATKPGHGIGTKSVIAFAKKYDGELLYEIENGVFQVRLLV